MKKINTKYRSVTDYIDHGAELDLQTASVKGLHHINLFWPLPVGQEPLLCIEVKAAPVLTMWVISEVNLLAYKAMIFDATGMCLSQYYYSQ